MAKESPSVADIFRRAQVVKRENPGLSNKDLKTRLLDEFKTAEFPSVKSLTIPEQDRRAPEEDWTAGLPLVLRGIQMKNWGEVINGIALSLEQTDNYERERGGAIGDDWHNRTVGIEDSLAKGVDKWMPDDLAKIAERATKK